MKTTLGGCLCGKIRYTISSPPLSQGICYCNECRKAGGACGSPVMVLREDSFLRPKEDLSICITHSEDGSRVMRYFCKECGSHIFAQIEGVPGIVTVKAASLDDFSAFKPEYLVWIRSAGRSTAFPLGIPSYSEEAPLEMLIGGGMANLIS